ncbi:RHS repeat-associated core domain-containing protein [Paenibacillus sp. OAS669]|uniref:RHS repeat-associated core domain-containing protein n=1 Tax=Paenibacillus sp. OAS669 TaxID=2663821 RepID=UPI001789807D|nr:RHS repeat-associated core domain-containing protein [Paenibacillus sp. OAS669]MBE1442606.1 RHS repeat-associated protein [Paenibacillus sp. OAS669]
MIKKIISSALSFVFFASTINPIYAASNQDGSQIYSSSNSVSTVTYDVYSESPIESEPLPFTQQQLAEMKTTFTPQMWNMAVYFYPELFKTLPENQKKDTLQFNFNTFIQQYEQLNEGERDKLNRLTPLVEIYYLRKKNPQAYDALIYSDLEKNSRTIVQAVYSKSGSLKAATSLNSNSPSQTLGEIKPFTFQENTDQLVDPMFRTSNQKDVDVHLSGLHGLDVDLIRSYNSMNAKITQPDYNLSGNIPKPITNQDRGFIATGWQLNIPTLKIEQNYDYIGWYSVPGAINDPSSPYYLKNFYSREHIDANSNLTDGWYPRITFTLDDGSTYEFRDNVSDQPFNQPYKNANYTVDENNVYRLTVNDQKIYEFVPKGNEWVVSSISNRLGDHIQYQLYSDKTLITDTVQRTIEITYDTGNAPIHISGITVKDNSGKLIRKISYNVQSRLFSGSLRSFIPSVGAYQPSPITVPYAQLNSVYDAVGNRTLKNYTYYEVDSKGIADFNLDAEYQFQVQSDLKTPVLDVNKGGSEANGSEASSIVEKDKGTYGEIAYLLLNQTTTDTGLTSQFMYSTYNPVWANQSDYKVRDRLRGSTRSYLDIWGLTYVGYHRVQSVILSYTDSDSTSKMLVINIHDNADGKAKEVWNYPKNASGRLSSSNSFRSGDISETTFSTDLGDFTATHSVGMQANGYYDNYGIYHNRPTKLAYEYDEGNGLINQINSTSGNKVLGYAPKVVTSYKYEADGNKDNTKPTSVYRFDSGASSDPRSQNVKDYLWGKSDNKPANIHNFANASNVQYDTFGMVVAEEDELGNHTEYAYSGPYRQVSMIKRTSSDGKQEVLLSYVYNGNGTIAKTTKTSKYRNPENDTLQSDTLITEYLAYNNKNQPTKIKENGSGDQFGAAIPETITDFEYDPSGLHITRESKKVKLAEGQPDSEVVVQYEYDNQDRLIKQIYPDQSKLEYGYDFKNRVTSQMFIPSPVNTDSERKVTLAYDDLNRVVTKTLPDKEQIITYYNPYSLVEKEQRKVGSTLRTIVANKYSLSGKLLKESYPYGEIDKKTTYLYGKNGQISVVTNALGLQTQTFYANVAYASDNGTGYLQSTVKTVEPDGKETWNYMDRFGQVQQITEQSETKNRTTQYVYTPFGKVSEQKVVAGGVTQTTTYGYDALGNLIYVKDNAGQVNKYVYNRLGEVIATYVNGKLKKQKMYNGNGWLLSTADSEGLSEHNQYQVTGLLDKHIDKKGQTYQYTYTPYWEEKRVSIFGESGAEVYWRNKSYDKDTRLLAGIENSENEKLSYSYDEWKRMKKQTVVGRDYGFGYDAVNDNLIKITFPDAKEVVYTHDKLNRIATVDYPGMGTVKYNYDIANNENTYTVNYPGNQRQQRKVDAFKELLSHSHQINGSVTRTETFGYDGFGNITTLSKNNQTYKFEYDGLNRIAKEILPQSQNLYRYDDQGNRLTLESDTVPIPEQEMSEFKYNVNNQLSDIDDNAGIQSHYSYYGDGLRASKLVNGVMTRYVYFNGKIIDELDGNGNFKARNIWGNELLWRQDQISNKSGYYYYNGHGDVVTIKDAAGNDINTYEYDIWGNVLSKKEGMNNPYRYTGELQDDESGLIYLRARYYDPAVGRFINEDTYEGDIKNPLSLNLYTYVHNNPLIYIDPTGHYCVSKDGNHAHEGQCNNGDGALTGNSASKYLGDDKDFQGQPIIENGVLNGYLGVTGAFLPEEMNYWSYAYTEWTNKNNNDLYYKLDRGTQETFRKQLLQGYVGGQIEQGFPDFKEGYVWGATLGRGGLLKSGLSKTLRSINKIDDKHLKRQGIDAHEVKRDFLGSKAQISRYDLYVDKATGEVLILLKGGKGDRIHTGIFIK